MENELTDKSPMPYGQHKGFKMEDVPAKYLMWLLEKKRANDRVKAYIISRKESIDMELNG